MEEDLRWPTRRGSQQGRDLCIWHTIADMPKVLEGCSRASHLRQLAKPTCAQAKVNVSWLKQGVHMVARSIERRQNQNLIMEGR